MAATTFGNSYAAQSLGMTPQSTGAADVTAVLKNQLAQLAKRRGVRASPVNGPMSAAAIDLVGRNPASG